MNSQVESGKMELWRDVHFWQDVTSQDWTDWKWQMKNAVRSPQKLWEILGQTFPLGTEDTELLSRVINAFEMKLTPFLVVAIHSAIRRGHLKAARAVVNAFVPTIAEAERVDDGIDGIGEELASVRPAPLVTNFYKNRVLLFAANMCPAYCRFCFRRRKVGDYLQEGVELATNEELLRNALCYIKENNAIREVIVSGGDPLMLSDGRLLSLLQQLREIDHVKVLRIDTKVLTTLPQRITPELVDGLRRCRPIYLVGNFLHSAELLPEVIRATSSLIDAGIPILSHTALLRDINDDPEIISELMWNLFQNRVIPYYLIHFIPTKWTEHFRVPIGRGLEIMESLHSRLSGIANPRYIVYLPDGAGKIPLLPNYLLERSDEGYRFRSFEGKAVLYKESKWHCDQSIHS